MFEDKVQKEINEYLFDKLNKNSMEVFPFLDDSWPAWQSYEDVKFKANSFGFRAEELTKLDSNKLNILYSGCSITFGYGLPPESMWTNMLTDKIKDVNETVEARNISYGGHSTLAIIKNVMAYIRNYGKPDFIFLLLPHTGRTVYFHVNRYHNVFPPFVSHLNPWQEKYQEGFSLETQLFADAQMINIFKDYCQEANINLTLATWSDYAYGFLGQSGLDNLLNLHQGIIFNEPKYNVNKDNLPYWLKAADHQHPGTLYNQIVAREMFKEFEKTYNKTN